MHDPARGTISDKQRLPHNREFALTDSRSGAGMTVMRTPPRGAPMQDVYAHIEDYVDESIAMLLDLVRQPSISAQGHRVRQGAGAGQADV